ncbi:VWA domain-containing protein [Streptomyces sp. NPDC005279]|uniref:VWA domain-containing protein n=1 Tax=Streptomyces sp. NPDC005279 TaxID=3364712 RepID=UPI0036B6EEE0
MQLRSKAGALVMAGALLALTGPLTATATESARAPAAAAAEGPDPIDFAVVVDQSKSLSDKDLTREVEAAALLSQGEISERSRAAVIGFGSSEKAGQTAVREVCGLTVADAAGRQRLSDCVQELSRRDPRRTGPGTDFPAALSQAVDRLSESTDEATPKVVFLLTDGKLDVRDSPEYGTDAASRQANGAKRLTEALARARRESVQVWPLGFGGEIDRAALTEMAEGGFRNGCADLPGATPRMRVVDSSTEIDKALQETFAAARCAQIAHGTVGKPPADLAVTIPPIATDGSITVSKHDPKVSVTYYDPSGRKVPTQGAFDGSTFEASGQDGPVEALRVKNPLPGRWRVRVEAPEGHRDREVAVRAIWQGRLRSAVTLDPAAPRAGEQAVVEIRMQTRRGVVVTDARQLAGVKVSARLSGSGFAPVTVKLADDGRAPDQRADDVRFTGTLTVPAGASGDLELTTQMAAPGVTADRRPLHARVTSGTPPVTAGLTVDRATVHPGATVGGTLDVTNNDSGPHTLRLALEDQAPGSALRISPATVTAAPGERTRARFTLSLGPGTPLGEVGGSVTVVDTGDDGRVLDTSFLDLRVEAPPTWWDRWSGAVIGGAALLLLLAVIAVIRLGARRRRRDLVGVQLELSMEGRSLDELTIRSGQSTGGEFHFTVDRATGAAPSLQRSTPGAPGSHRLRRTGGGELLLRPHQGREHAVRAGESTGIADGLELVVRDRRSPAGRPPRGERGRTRTGRAPGVRTGDDARTPPRGRWSRPHRGNDAADRPRPGGDPAGTGEQAAGTRRFDPNF